MAVDAKPITHVLDRELLYRSVRDADDHHSCDSDGKLIRLGQSTFNDPERKPSVSRADLCVLGSEASRLAPEHGVVTLSAVEVRGIAGVISNNSKGKLLFVHNVDVVHVPVEENYAHGQIESSPHASSDGAWKKLKEALCQIALMRGWTCPPASSRNMRQ